MVRLEDGLEYLSGVGQKRILLYAKLGIKTVGDLIYHFPRSYIDFFNIKSVKEALPLEFSTVKAKIASVLRPRHLKGGKSLYQATAIDESGDMIEIVFFNNPYVLKALKREEYYLFHGKVEGSTLMKKMINPKTIKEGDRGFEGVYRLTFGLSSNMVRANISQALKLVKIERTLPREIISKYDLLSLMDALEKIHFPKSLDDIDKARRRLAFEELLVWQLGLGLLRLGSEKKTDIVLKQPDLRPFYESLPFNLTRAQEKVLQEALKDCLKNRPANRLIQGDVGSGKTVIAAAILYLFAKSGYQGAMMAPTDILARQHFSTISAMTKKLEVTTALLTGSMSAAEKKEQRQKIQSGEVQIVIGTHTLFQGATEFKNLGVVVTDEQHRFGVNQRQRLTQKGDNPHTLVMSATPIPRSLALIMYGDLDISTIDELPAGRQKIDTFFISDSKRQRALKFIKEQLYLGNRAYIICPLVEEGQRQAKAVETYARQLKETVFKGYGVGVLHGKLKKEQKEKAMEDFASGNTPLLIATTVVEVGIDVKEATVIMIENAELFGLSQLHQLRGRVGRGDKKSYCILVSSLKTKENYKRLNAMCRTNDGFEIAREDLSERGPGDFFGDRQHGLPKFKIADIFVDMILLNQCKEEALKIIKEQRYKMEEYYKIYDKAQEILDNDVL